MITESQSFFVDQLISRVLLRALMHAGPGCPTRLDPPRPCGTCPPEAHEWRAMIPGRWQPGMLPEHGRWWGRYYDCRLCGTSRLRPGGRPNQGGGPGGPKAAQARTLTWARQRLAGVA